MDNIQRKVYSRNYFFIYLFAGIVAVGGILFGYDTGVISGAIVFIRPALDVTTFQTEIIVSAVLIGAFLGALGSGKLADYYGRRAALLVAAIGYIIGSLLSAYAPNANILIFARIVVGVSIGISSYVVPLYISEIAPAEKRGGLIILNTVAVTGGILISYFVDYGFSFIEGWRWMLGVGAIPALFMLLGVLFVSESPRWLMQQNYFKEAKKILQKISGKTGVDRELKEIRQIIINSKQESWRELFAPLLRPVLMVGFGLAIIQQVSGINVILYYAPIIFQASGFHETSTQMLATVSMGATNFLMTIVALWLVDKVGRRKLLLFGLTVTTISLAVLASSFHFAEGLELLKWVCVYSLVLFIAGYAISIGCLFWLLISEIYPLDVRGKAMSLVTSVNWMANFIIALTFLSLLETFGASATFWLYTAFGVLSLVFCYYLIPETKLVSLEQIERNLRGGRKIRELGALNLS